MSVSDGQTANQTTFNDAFISKTVNSTTVGQVTLNNADSAAGTQITNIQREFNSLSSFLGKLVNVAKDAVPAWTSGASGSVFTRLNSISETVFAEPAQLLKNVRTEASTGTILDLATTSPVIGINGSVTTFVAGIAGGVAGKIIFLVNYNGTDAAGLVHNSGSAAAGDKIRLPSETALSLSPFEGAVLCYYSGYWHMVGKVGGAAGAGAGTGYFNLTINESSVAPTPLFISAFKEWEFKEQTGQAIVAVVTVPDSLGPVNLQCKFLMSGAATGNVVFNTNTKVFVPVNATRGSPIATDNENTTVAVGTIDEMVEVTLPVTQNLNDSVGNEDVIGGATLAITIRRAVSGSDTVADVIRIVEGSIRIVEV